MGGVRGRGKGVPEETKRRIGNGKKGSHHKQKQEYELKIQGIKRGGNLRERNKNRTRGGNTKGKIEKHSCRKLSQDKKKNKRKKTPKKGNGGLKK